MSYLDLKPNTNPAKIVIIQSKNRESTIDGNPSTPTNFKILLPDIGKIKQMSISHVTIPFTWNNIDETNNKIGIEVGGILTTYTLTTGGYDAYSLAAALTAMFGTSAFIVSFNTNTKKLSIQSKTSTQFYVRLGSIPNNMHEIIGFDNLDYGPDIYFEGIKPMNLNPDDILLIKCKPFVADNASNIIIPGGSVQDKSILGAVPITANPGETIMCNLSWMAPIPVNLSDQFYLAPYMTIKLTRANSETPINMNSVDWTMVLYVFTN